MANNTDLYKADSYKLFELSITNWKGEKLDISTRFLTIDINQSIFNTTVSGTIIIEDIDDFIQNLPYIGEETLNIEFSIDEDTEHYTKSFYIYHISDIVEEFNHLKTYEIHFCSEEMLVNKNVRVKKGFKSRNLKDIIKSIFNELESEKEINIDDCIGQYNYLTNNQYPFYIINSLLSRGIHPQHQDGSCYVFFENNDGFNFRSIESIIDEAPILEYKFRMACISSDSPLDESLAINSHEINKKSNVLENIQKGTYGNKVGSYDPITKQYKEVTYEYDNEELYNKTNHSVGNFKNRIHSEEFKFTNSDSYFKFVISDSDRNKSKFISSRVDTNSYDNKDNYLSKRITQMNQFTNMLSLTIEVPGNNILQCGKTLYLEYPSFSSVDIENKVNDVYMEGKYLIVSCRHVLTRDKYLTVVEISRDQYNSNIKEKTKERSEELFLIS